MGAVVPAAVQVYDKDTAGKLTENFVLAEFHCQCPSALCVYSFVSMALVTCLQIIRDRIGQSIYVTSGYRCPQHNEDEGAEPDSRHVAGMAADITTMDKSITEQIYMHAMSLQTIRGIGRYEYNGKLVRLHLDVRPLSGVKKAVWTVAV